MKYMIRCTQSVLLAAAVIAIAYLACGVKESSTTNTIDFNSYQEEIMASWMVSGAGESSYDGIYTEVGIRNGKYYYSNGTMFLYWNTMSWVIDYYLSDEIGRYYGTGENLPASPWTTGTGLAPAPSVSEYEPISITWLPNCSVDERGFYLCSGVTGSHIICFYNPPVLYGVGGYYNTGYSEGICKVDAFELVVHHAVLGGFPAFKSINIYQYTKAEFLLEDQDAQVLTGALIHTCNTSGSGDTLLVSDVDVRHTIDFTSLDDGVYYFIARGIHDDNTAEQCIAKLYVDRTAGEDPPEDPEDPEPVPSGIDVIWAELQASPLGDITPQTTSLKALCAIAIESGSISSVIYYLYVNGILTAQFIDESITTGGYYDHTFVGLSLSSGDICKIQVYAYDDNDDYDFASSSKGVGGVKYKSLILGDAAADFSGWSFTDCEVVNTDDIALSATAGIYKSAGSLVLQFDSGYSSTTWDLLSFSDNEPLNTSIRYYIRVADTQEGLSSATYYPLAGISESGYNLSEDTDITSGRWVEIKAVLSTTDTSVTPTVYSIEIFYSVDSNTLSTKKWDTTAELNEGTLSDIVVADGIATLGGSISNVYATPGTFLLRLDTGGISDFTKVSWVATVPTGTLISVRTRSFDDIRYASDATWSDAIIVSGSPITSADGIFLDVEVTLSTTDVLASPELTSLTVEFEQSIEPGISYVYTSEFELPSNLESLLLTDVQYNQDPACSVQYRFAVDGATNWNLMRDINPNELLLVQTGEYLSGTSLRVAARMICQSTTTAARIDEIGLLFSLEDGQTTQIL